MIDTHLHIWDPNKIKYNWLSEAPKILNKVYSLRDIESTIKTFGIKSAILIQAANNVYETKFLLEEAAKVDWIVAVVGWVDLQSPKAIESQIKDYQSNFLKGIRHLINIEKNEEWILQKEVLKSLEILEHLNLSFDFVGTTIKHLMCAKKIAKLFPNLRIIIDHLNQPPTNFSESSSWIRNAIALSEHENIYYKFSGLGTVSNIENTWTWNDIRQWTDFFLNNYNKNRILLGSDWPICQINSTYTTSFTQYLKTIQNCDEEVFHNITYRNAINAYNLEIMET